MSWMARRSPEETGAGEFGRRLRELRRSRGWTQLDLARRLGIERAIVGNYELGLHYPAMPMLAKLAQALEVSTDRLLGLEESRPADIQDRRLHQLFLEADRVDFGTQGVIKQVVESLLATAPASRRRTGTHG